MEKILFKIKSLGIGGIERLTIDILNELKIENKEIILMLENREENELKGQLNKNIEVVYLKPEWFNPLLYKIRDKKKKIFFKILYNFLLFLERFILSYNINKYIKNNKGIKLFIDYNGGSTKYIHRIKNVKKILWCHTSISHMSGGKIKRYGKKLFKYDLVVAICKEMENELLKNYPYLKNKIKTIYNFIDLEKILAKSNNSMIEKKERLKENYCISIGRLVAPKDYITTIKAFQILKEKGIYKKLYIVGDGPDIENLKQYIKKINMEDQIILLGMQENPYIWLKNADFFIHSSKIEGFPMVLLEAMACEKIIISSICKTGVKEILDLGVGEGFRIGDYKELAILIEKVLKMPKEEKESKYISNIKKNINKFSKQVILKEYKDIMIKYSI